MAGGGERKYSCETATETMEWIHAIKDFLEPYRFFLDAHVVNFFKDRLWEAVDREWMDCLKKEPVDKLLQIPSGVVQDHWPASLKEYVRTLRSLSLPRDQADMQEVFPCARVAPPNNVISQCMNQKKKKMNLKNNGYSRPITVTCQLLSPGMLKDVSSSIVQVDDLEKPTIIRKQSDGKTLEGIHGSKSASLKASDKSSMVLAGLHACGDLSVTMLRPLLILLESR